eukprot:TRINITY_DN781874_c0_g1_i1.p1 TRINITY_DN781874_c0_g1~~TRINITY_DN781874_c0_g1_i1.p1  ORF type:complete len:281 (+),score=74.12 TRINITY_DN781874_c0_g1_i1:66-908(+)
MNRRDVVVPRLGFENVKIKTSTPKTNILNDLGIEEDDKMSPIRYRSPPRGQFCSPVASPLLKRTPRQKVGRRTPGPFLRSPNPTPKKNRKSPARIINFTPSKKRKSLNFDDVLSPVKRSKPDTVSIPNDMFEELSYVGMAGNTTDIIPKEATKDGLQKSKSMRREIDEIVMQNKIHVEFDAELKRTTTLECIEPEKECESSEDEEAKEILQANLKEKEMIRQISAVIESKNNTKEIKEAGTIEKQQHATNYSNWSDSGLDRSWSLDSSGTPGNSQRESCY